MIPGRPEPWLARGDSRTRLLKLGVLVLGIPVVLGFIASVVLWISVARTIDSRLGGERLDDVDVAPPAELHAASRPRLTMPAMPSAVVREDLIVTPS